MYKGEERTSNRTSIYPLHMLFSIFQRLDKFAPKKPKNLTKHEEKLLEPYNYRSLTAIIKLI